MVGHDIFKFLSFFFSFFFLLSVSEGLTNISFMNTQTFIYKVGYGIVHITCGRLDQKYVVAKYKQPGNFGGTSDYCNKVKPVKSKNLLLHPISGGLIIAVLRVFLTAHPHTKTQIMPCSLLGAEVSKHLCLEFSLFGDTLGS